MNLPSAADRLRSLADELGSLPAADRERVVAAAQAVRARIAAEQSWRATAHLHAHTDEDVLCHDCGRHLVSDAGVERILVCPQLHGRRPPELNPATGQAVECGQKGGS